MARFRGSVVGQRGDGASRLGSRVSGLSTETNGWDSGVRVIASVTPDDRDQFDIYATGGSNGGGRDRLIATVIDDTLEMEVEAICANSAEFCPSTLADLELTYDKAIDRLVAARDKIATAQAAEVGVR